MFYDLQCTVSKCNTYSGSRGLLIYTAMKELHLASMNVQDGLPGGQLHNLFLSLSFQFDFGLYYSTLSRIDLNDTVMFLAMMRYLLSGEPQRTNKQVQGKKSCNSNFANCKFSFLLYMHRNSLKTFGITMPWIPTL